MIELIIDRPNWQTTRQRLVFGSMTAIFWAWATITDRLKEPELQVETDMEIHGEPTI